RGVRHLPARPRASRTRGCYAFSVQMSADSERIAGLLGDTLRRRREELGRSLRSTAGSAGISPGHLSDVERGRKELSLERLGDVARALETSAGEIFLDLAIALGAAPPRPARHPAALAPNPPAPTASPPPTPPRTGPPP